MFAVAALRQKKVIEHETTFLSEIRNGDTRAFELIFREHYQPLCRYAHSLITDQEESEDLVQQVFVNFWENREQTIITGSLKSYLFRSVHNQCLNLLKHDKVKAKYMQHSLYFESHFQWMVEEDLEGGELQSKIEAAIEKLPTECQKIFKMSRFEELKYKEIAEMLNLSVKTVENQIGKALKLLRHSLSDCFIYILLMLFGR